MLLGTFWFMDLGESKYSLEIRKQKRLALGCCFFFLEGEFFFGGAHFCCWEKRLRNFGKSGA